MAPNNVVLILGSGPRIGAAVAARFAASGYRVAIASRKGTDSSNAEGHFYIKADLARPETVPAVFRAVTAQFGVAPNAVIYNAASLTPPPDEDDPLSIPAQGLGNDLNINVISAYTAAQEAVKGFDTLPREVKKTFIYTGNVMNTTVVPVPMMLTLGVGKAASAYWVGVTDGAYASKGYRFFYADERHPDGKFKGMALDGPAHGEFYEALATQTGNVPWHATFLKGQGYTKF